MKKALASIALLVSATSAQALVGTGVDSGKGKPVATVNQCVTVYEDKGGVMYLNDCDETAINKYYKVKLEKNGCAIGQASFKSAKPVFPMCTR